MRKAYYVACGLVYEIAFLAALAVVWRTESVFAAIVVAVPTGFLLSRCVTRTPAFRPVKDSLLWLGTVDGAAALKTSGMAQICCRNFHKTLDFSLRIWYPI